MNISKTLNYIGPGLMYAGAAIGVSHLVQSTRAGALFGFQLLALILVVNIIKYPFFEAGSRYSAATGNNLIYAYGQINKKWLWFYAIQTFITMFIIQAALTIVASGLLKNLFQLQIPAWSAAAIISMACLFILLIGQYKVLKSMTKWIVISLTICTVIALMFAIAKPVTTVENTTTFSFNNAKNVAFLVALIGWMPAPIDISVWQSVWRVDGKEELNLKKSLIDFHIGYWGTTIISLIFLSLGALIFYSSGEQLSSSAGGFSTQLVSIYTTAVGSWAWPIVAFAAFATMFTSCLTCLDASPRVFERTIQEIGYKPKRYLYITLVISSVFGSILIPLLSGKSMTSLVDFATTVSFVTGPIFATLNFAVQFGSLTPKNQQPSKFTYYLSILGLIFLYAFSIYFLIQIF